MSRTDVNHRRRDLSAANETASRDRLAILVVEKDARTRRLLCDILRSDDYEVLEAKNFAQLRDCQPWDRILAVILDRSLPDAPAEKVLPHVKSVAPEAAVLMVTGRKDLDGAINALREGVDDYILKPINPQWMRASLSRVLRRRQLAEEKLNSDAAFRNLVEAASCMIVILRDDYTIAYFNPFAEELTGYAAGEILGREYPHLFLPESERTGLTEELARVVSGHSIRDYEKQVVCRDGSRRWVVWSARRLDDFTGQPAILAIGQDITQRKRAEERALQAERLAAIGQTVAGLAHESRNAFQRSQACLELLMLELEDRPDELELVARIQRALNHLHHLYEEVRDYAAPIKLDWNTCELASVWRDAWTHLEVARSDKMIQIHEESETTDLSCRADWFAIGQVFRNVFENAITACPNPGNIWISTCPTKLGDRNAIRVAVRDDGPGVRPEDRQHVFDAFYTTRIQGTGLGMAIARRIVEAHGGRIEVGQPMHGAEFVITLPT